MAVLYVCVSRKRRKGAAAEIRHPRPDVSLNGDHCAITFARSGVRLREADHQPLPGCLCQPAERRKTGHVGSALEPRNGWRGGAHPMSQLLLREVVLHPELDEETGNRLRAREPSPDLPVLRIRLLA